jgi:hypothetical protein
MKKKTQQTMNDKNSITKGEHKFIGLIIYLIRSDLKWFGRPLMKILRMKWHGRPIQTEHDPKEVTPLPTGPFMTSRKNQVGDLLLWVPRQIDSYLIDDLTGGYGYSHSTIDTGEIDIPTGKPVMIEITIGQTVSRKFQDEYEQRAVVRVPISQTGVDVDQFVACIKSKLGEQYDSWDAITLGEIEEPAKEVCSGLAADCLPEQDLKRIARAQRLGLLRRASVSVHSKPGALETREFISPNGFAEYYGAPKGRKLTGQDITIQPQPIEISAESVAASAARHHGWKLATGVFASALLVIILKRTR